MNFFIFIFVIFFQAFNNINLSFSSKINFPPNFSILFFKTLKLFFSSSKFLSGFFTSIFISLLLSFFLISLISLFSFSFEIASSLIFVSVLSFFPSFNIVLSAHISNSSFLLFSMFLSSDNLLFSLVLELFPSGPTLLFYCLNVLFLFLFFSNCISDIYNNLNDNKIFFH